MSVKIIVDSTADMRPEVAAKVGIVPLSVHFGDQDYISGVTITAQQFYEMLVESDTLPTTSQPAPYLFEEAYEKAKMSGEMYLTGQGAFLYTKLFVNEMITQKGLISSDMLDDDQVEQYLAWAAELGITYNIEIKEGVVCED
jgi:hypothetical protein